MMKLSIMGLGDRRFDPSGELPLAGWAHERWSHDPGSLAIFRYSSNFVFSFRDGGERRFLRSAHESQRSRAQIAAEVDLLVWLAAEGISLATPLPSRLGNLVESIETEFGTFHAVVFAGLEGVQRDIEDCAEDDFHPWGAALGRLHAAIRRYPGLQSARRSSWRDDLALVVRHLPSGESAIARECDEIGNALAGLPINPDTYGLIHFDFELDNIIWKNGTLSSIDFDDCAYHWYAADISFALRDLFDDGVSVVDPRVQAFLDGYRAHQPIDDIMLSHLPLFSRLARLSVYGRVARALDLTPDGAAQPWLRDLEGRLKAKMDAYPASLGAWTAAH